MGRRSAGGRAAAAAGGGAEVLAIADAALRAEKRRVEAEGQGERAERTERSVFRCVIFTICKGQLVIGKCRCGKSGRLGRPFDFLQQKAEAAENQFRTGPKQFVTEGSTQEAWYGGTKPI